MDENPFNKRSSTSMEHGLCEDPEECRLTHEASMARLRRLWKVLARKTEKTEFEEVTLCGPNVARFLSEQLSSGCQWVRYAALDLLCGAVPRLGDPLLQPLVPRALQGPPDAPRHVRLKALHFLRALRKHSTDLHSFVTLYVEHGLESENAALRVACIHGTSIVFDEDLEDPHYALLLPALARSAHRLPAFRALRRIHARIGPARFHALSGHAYADLLRFEEGDPYLALDPRTAPLAAFIDAYRRKRRRLRLPLAFGVADPALLEALRDQTDESAPRALETAVRSAAWSEADMEAHVPDLLQLAAGMMCAKGGTSAVRMRAESVKSVKGVKGTKSTQEFGMRCSKTEHESGMRCAKGVKFSLEPETSAAESALREAGLGMVSELASRLGLALASHVERVVRALLAARLAGAERVVGRLMREVHPMTVLLEVLRTGDEDKERAVRMVMARIRRLPYHYVDIMTLCRCMGQWSSESPDVGVRRASKECLELLMDIIDNSPLPDLKAQVLNTLIRDKLLQPRPLTTDERRTYGGGVEVPGDFKLATPTTDVTSGRGGEGDTEQSTPSGKGVEREPCPSEGTLQDQQINCQEKQMNPEKYNFNILRICTPPDTPQSVLELEGGDEAGTIVHPSSVLEPQDPEASSVPDFAGRYEELESSYQEVASEVESPYEEVASEAVSPYQSVISENLYEEVASEEEITYQEAVSEVESPYEEVASDVESPYHQENSEAECSYQDVTSEVESPYQISEADSPFQEVTSEVESPYQEAISEVESPYEEISEEKVPIASFVDQTSDLSDSEGKQRHLEGEDVVHLTNFSDHSCYEYLSDSSTQVEAPLPFQTKTSAKRASEAEPKKSTRAVSLTEMDVPMKSGVVKKHAVLKSPSVVRSVRGGHPVKKSTARNCDRRDGSAIKKTVEDKWVHQDIDGESLDSSEIFTAADVPAAKLRQQGQTKALKKTIKDKLIHQDIDEESVYSSEIFTAADEPTARHPLQQDPVQTKALKKTVKNKRFQPNIDEESVDSSELCAAADMPTTKQLQKQGQTKAMNKVVKDKRIHQEIDEESVDSSEICSDVHPLQQGLGRTKAFKKTIGEQMIQHEIDEESLDSSEIFVAAAAKKPLQQVSTVKGKRTHQDIDDSLDTSEIIKGERPKERGDFGFDEDEEEITVPPASYPIENMSEASPPFRKGRELPRTPVKVSEQSDLMPEKKTKKPTNKKTQKVAKGTIKKAEPIKKRVLKKASPKVEEEVIEVEEPTIEEDREVGESTFKGSQWRRDLEYASKGGECAWAKRFEGSVLRMRPFESDDAAEAAFKKALDDLEGDHWQSKEEAMSCVLRAAKHHPRLVEEQAARLVVAVCAEVKNFRQSVAGKAILTAGHLYALMGRQLEGKLRLVVGALLMKSGNRTLAAYFRLVIRSLFQIIRHSALPKAALAFLKEGSRHANKASRETAAQFLSVMTEGLGWKGALSPPVAPHLLRAAHAFAFDCSPLSRYCGKRILQVLMGCPSLDRLREQHLDIDASASLAKVLEQIEARGVSEELLPIHLIK